MPTTIAQNTRLTKITTPLKFASRLQDINQSQKRLHLVRYFDKNKKIRISTVETFRVGLKKTVMLEIKPRVDTAAIFSTINKGGDYLVLELLKGDVS